jgi:predicted secreted protein
MNLRKNLKFCIAALIACSSIGSIDAQAQASGIAATQIIVPAYGEVVQANDQAQATLMVEEQDKDKAAAASRVNQKMNQGISLLRQQDPQAKLKTRGYYTYAIYPEDQPHNNGVSAKLRQPIGWRVGQYLELTTTNLKALPQTIAAAQGQMALNGLNFSLSPAAAKQSDAALIDATYKNLTERMASIAHAMGRNPADLLLDTLDFEGSGNYAPNEAMPKAMMMRAAAPAQDSVAEPSFEPGETALTMRAVGKLKFK